VKFAVYGLARAAFLLVAISIGTQTREPCTVSIVNNLTSSAAKGANRASFWLSFDPASKPEVWIASKRNEHRLPEREIQRGASQAKPE
jgi:hypothetical protein